MKTHENSFQNRGLKKMYLFTPLIFIVLSTVIYFFLPKGFWGGFGGGIGAFLIITASQSIKYMITEENTLEFYHLFGRWKSKSISIASISEIMQKRHQLHVEYIKKGYRYPSTIILELSDKNMSAMKHELLQRNSKIVVS